MMMAAGLGIGWLTDSTTVSCLVKGMMTSNWSYKWKNVKKSNIGTYIVESFEPGSSGVTLGQGALGS